MTLLDSTRNLGIVTAAEFASLGIHTLEQLRGMGGLEACCLWVERFPRRANLNAFRAVIGAMLDVPCTAVPEDEDREARRLLARLPSRPNPGR